MYKGKCPKQIRLFALEKGYWKEIYFEDNFHKRLPAVEEDLTAIILRAHGAPALSVHLLTPIPVGDHDRDLPHHFYLLLLSLLLLSCPPVANEPRLKI